MITWRKYRPGDIAAVQCSEPEPFDGWADYAEQQGKGLATVEKDGRPVAVMGCLPCWDGVADCFNVIDREAVKGYGRPLSEMSRARILQVMQALGIHRMQATASVTDRQAQVFLRSIGFRRESVLIQGAPDRSDLAMFVILEAGP